MKDYVEEDTETVVLSRWDKIKQWIEIIMATKKVAMLIWGLVFSVGGTMAVGKITNTNPLRDAAIEVGLVDEVLTDELTIKEDSIDNHLHKEIIKLISEIKDIQKEITVLEARAGRAGEAGPAGPIGKNGIDGRNGKDGRDGRDGKDGTGAGLSMEEFNTGIEKHIAGDH